MQANPFTRLPERELGAMREYFAKSEFADRMDFDGYLALLYEDDLVPEEVLDIIAFDGSTGGKTYSCLEEMKADAKRI